MTILIVLGNTNQYTFANSIVAARYKSEQIFGNMLTSIYVFHSSGSNEELAKERGWVDHLRANGINQELIVSQIVDIATSRESIERFVSHIEVILRGHSESANVIVDLTNGTTLQKNLLSIATYILDLQHQYLIDIIKLRNVSTV